MPKPYAEHRANLLNHAAPNAISLAPRGLCKQAAAAYVGCASDAAFDDWVARGIVPGPIPGTKRWDRKAIDLALDLASGITTEAATPSDPLAEWKAHKGRH